jgi:hypothetical protein
MKLTKRKALEICIELWEWLAEDAGRNKKNWPGWEKYGPMDNQCPCCAWLTKALCRNCSRCPIYWGSRKGHHRCELHQESPFAKWHNTFGEGREKYALEIVELARTALSKLK